MSVTNYTRFPIYHECTQCFPNNSRSFSTGFDLDSFSSFVECIGGCQKNSDTLSTSILSYDLCTALAGTALFTWYTLAHIWGRLATWKFPLLQLIAIFPRPPLGFWPEVFELVHLLGDPINTIANLILKIRSCQRRAYGWQTKIDDHTLSEFVEDEVLEGNGVLNPSTRYTARHRLWKRLAIIVTSYDEWGLDVGDKVKAALTTAFSRSSEGYTRRQLRKLRKKQRSLLKKCYQTAKALAADRTTKFLPICAAQAFFVGSIALALARIKEASFGSNPDEFANLAFHAVAYSLLYFWLLTAVFLGAVVGVSQSADAMPRILRKFRQDVNRLFPDELSQLPLGAELCKARDRRNLGGMYTWLKPASRERAVAHACGHQIDEARDHSQVPGVRGFVDTVLRAIYSGFWRLVDTATLIGTAAVLSCGLFSMLISWRVPPTGFGCRGRSELGISVWWLGSTLWNAFCFSNDQWQFYLTLVKDLVIIIMTMGWTFATMIGWYNRCDCYKHDGSDGLELPFFPSVRADLEYREAHEYKFEVLGCAVVLLTMPVLLTWRYWDAMRVFLQRDDDSSNLWLLHWLLDALGKVYVALKMSWSRASGWTLRQLPRTATGGLLEQGGMAPLTDRGGTAAAPNDAGRVNPLGRQLSADVEEPLLEAPERVAATGVIEEPVRLRLSN